MTVGRGALLVLEGCDRAGKSTQVKKLVQALNARGITAEARAFPDRKTVIGEVVGRFLSFGQDLPPETVHLLFAANRWECSAEMVKTIQAGTTLVVDRYAGSGAAYTAATTGKDLFWCKEADRGLPRPDLVALLEVSETTQKARAAWGKERFEREEIQRKVASNLRNLRDDSWQILDADQSIEELHTRLLEIALEAIDKAKDTPLGALYSS